MSRLTKQIGYLGAALGLIAPVGCAGPESSKRLPGGYRLVQKDQFQALLCQASMRNALVRPELLEALVEEGAGEKA